MSDCAKPKDDAKVEEPKVETPSELTPAAPRTPCNSMTELDRILGGEEFERLALTVGSRPPTAVELAVGYKKIIKDPEQHRIALENWEKRHELVPKKQGPPPNADKGDFHEDLEFIKAEFDKAEAIDLKNAEKMKKFYK